MWPPFLMVKLWLLLTISLHTVWASERSVHVRDTRRLLVFADYSMRRNAKETLLNDHEEASLQWEDLEVASKPPPVNLFEQEDATVPNNSPQPTGMEDSDEPADSIATEEISSSAQTPEDQPVNDDENDFLPGVEYYDLLPFSLAVTGNSDVTSMLGIDHYLQKEMEKTFVNLVDIYIINFTVQAHEVMESHDNNDGQYLYEDPHIHINKLFFTGLAEFELVENATAVDPTMVQLVQSRALENVTKLQDYWVQGNWTHWDPSLLIENITMPPVPVPPPSNSTDITPDELESNVWPLLVVTVALVGICLCFIRFLGYMKALAAGAQAKYNKKYGMGYFGESFKDEYLVQQSEHSYAGDPSDRSTKDFNYPSGSITLQATNGAGKSPHDSSEQLDPSLTDHEALHNSESLDRGSNHSRRSNSSRGSSHKTNGANQRKGYLLGTVGQIGAAVGQAGAETVRRLSKRRLLTEEHSTEDSGDEQEEMEASFSCGEVRPIFTDVGMLAATAESQEEEDEDDASDDPNNDTNLDSTLNASNVGRAIPKDFIEFRDEILEINDNSNLNIFLAESRSNKSILDRRESYNSVDSNYTFYSCNSGFG